MRTITRTLVLVALLWTAAASPSLAITYTTLDYPGSVTTLASGIEGSNIVGTYTDSSGNHHGFLYDGATYATLANLPGTDGIVPHDISGGNIVGLYHDSSGQHGFLYDGSTYASLDDPLATIGTYAYGIDGNNIVGHYVGSGRHGFLYDGTTYTTLDDPLATSATIAHGIDGNSIVGEYTDSSSTHGFSYDGTTYTTLDVPGSVGTAAYAISGDNIVGNYGDGAKTHGFLYDGTTYTTIDFPGNLFMEVNGVDGNNIVGYYGDSSGTHGFLANVPEPSSGVLGVIACGLMWRWIGRRKSWCLAGSTEFLCRSPETGSSMRFFAAALLAIMTSSCAISVASAGTFQITGRVRQATSFTVGISGLMQVNDPFQLTYSFDPTLPDTNVNSTYGVYEQSVGGPYFLNGSAGSFAFSATDTFKMIVQNQDAIFPDNYSVQIAVSDVGFAGNFPAGTAPNNTQMYMPIAYEIPDSQGDANLLTPPDLASIPANDKNFQFHFKDASNTTVAQFFAFVDDAHIVPEPTTFISAGLALIALVALTSHSRSRVSGSGGTSASAISRNNIVGYYHDSSGNHGFLATVPEPGTVLLGALGAMGLLLRRTASH